MDLMSMWLTETGRLLLGTCAASVLEVLTPPSYYVRFSTDIHNA